MAEQTPTCAPPGLRRTEDARWTCPVCATEIIHPHRPGRRRVYCTNSCKQRAYRWRRDRRAVLVTPRPPERAHSGYAIHALRADGDPIAKKALDRPFRPMQRVTACGTFAFAARDRRNSWAHTRFHARSDPLDPDRPDVGVCASCVRLTNTPLQPVADILQRRMAA